MTRHKKTGPRALFFVPVRRSKRIMSPRHGALWFSPDFVNARDGQDQQMVLINHFCPISAAKIAGLKTTVVLLLVMLMKSKLLRIKMSLLGSVLGFAMLVGFLLTTGLLTVITGGAVAYAATQNRNN